MAAALEEHPQDIRSWLLLPLSSQPEFLLPHLSSWEEGWQINVLRCVWWRWWYCCFPSLLSEMPSGRANRGWVGWPRVVRAIIFLLEAFEIHLSRISCWELRILNVFILFWTEILEILLVSCWKVTLQEFAIDLVLAELCRHVGSSPVFSFFVSSSQPPPSRYQRVGAHGIKPAPENILDTMHITM